MLRVRGGHIGVSPGIGDHTSSSTSHIVTLPPRTLTPCPPMTCLLAPGRMGPHSNSHHWHGGGAVASVASVAEVAEEVVEGANLPHRSYRHS